MQTADHRETELIKAQAQARLALLQDCQIADGGFADDLRSRAICTAPARRADRPRGPPPFASRLWGRRARAGFTTPPMRRDCWSRSTPSLDTSASPPGTPRSLWTPLVATLADHGGARRPAAPDDQIMSSTTAGRCQILSLRTPWPPRPLSGGLCDLGRRRGGAPLARPAPQRWQRLFQACAIRHRNPAHGAIQASQRCASRAIQDAPRSPRHRMSCDPEQASASRAEPRAGITGTRRNSAARTMLTRTS